MRARALTLGARDLALALLGLLSVPAGSEAAELPAACGAGVWTLKGAALASEGGRRADFSSAWEPALEGVVACAARPEVADSCVEVQGRFDAQPFPDEVVRVYGSPKAAQSARAHGRAANVVAWLHGKGVPAARIVEVPPPQEASFRGAQIRLRRGCHAASTEPAPARPASDLDRAVQAAVAEAVPPAVDGATRQAEARLAQAAASCGAATVEEAVERVVERRLATQTGPSPPEDTDGLSLLLGFAGDGLVLTPDNALSGGLRAGLVWRGGPIYARVALDAAAGTTLAQRRSLEVAGSIGWAPLAWLELGPELGWRRSGENSDDPWAERGWFVGLYSAQCTGTFGPGFRLCAEEAVSPFGTESTVTCSEWASGVCPLGWTCPIWSRSRFLSKGPSGTSTSTSAQSFLRRWP